VEVVDVAQVEVVVQEDIEHQLSSSFKFRNKIIIRWWNLSNNSWRRWSKRIFSLLVEQGSVLQYFQQLHLQEEVVEQLVVIL
jgi:uncharacterized protein YutE (UPF0331/DUF86 family)